MMKYVLLLILMSQVSCSIFTKRSVYFDVPSVSDISVQKQMVEDARKELDQPEPDLRFIRSALTVASDTLELVLTERDMLRERLIESIKENDSLMVDVLVAEEKLKSYRKFFTGLFILFGGLASIYVVLFILRLKLRGVF